MVTFKNLNKTWYFHIMTKGCFRNERPLAYFSPLPHLIEKKDFYNYANQENLKVIYTDNRRDLWVEPLVHCRFQELARDCTTYKTVNSGSIQKLSMFYSNYGPASKKKLLKFMGTDLERAKGCSLFFGTGRSREKEAFLLISFTQLLQLLVSFFFLDVNFNLISVVIKP